jgi:hypothetical protein
MRRALSLMGRRTRLPPAGLASGPLPSIPSDSLAWQSTTVSAEFRLYVRERIDDCDRPEPFDQAGEVVTGRRTPQR